MTLHSSLFRLFCFLGLCAWLSLQSGGSPSVGAGNSQSANAKPVAHFTDVAQQAGLTAPVIFGGENTKKYIIETTGTGVAIFDYDNDGWPDIFVVNGTTLEPLAGKRPPTNHLYHNNRNETFTDVSETAHVAGSGKSWGTGCAFVDYDRDGKLDLFVATYVDFDVTTAPAPGERASCMWKGVPVMCGPRGLPWGKNILYHNKGDGTFEDVTTKAKIDQTNGQYGVSVSTLDFDDDGWPDIYDACDSTTSILYHNNRDGTFTDVAVVAGAAFNDDGREQAGMGSTVGDYDGDGRLDLFKTNFSDDTSTLYRNNGDGTFDDKTFPAGFGLNTQYLGLGVMFADVDNDGWPDLLLVNGHVYPEVDSQHLGSNFREPKILYHNNGNGKFTDISATAGPGITAVSSARGLAIGDLWNDGRISAVISNMNAPPMLLVNDLRNGNHWIAFHTIGKAAATPAPGLKSNRDGIGAKITVKAGTRTLVDEVRSGSSYISNNDMRVHFGLGSATKIDWVQVRWPSGLVERFENLPVDTIKILKEGSGAPANTPLAKP